MIIRILAVCVSIFSISCVFSVDVAQAQVAPEVRRAADAHAEWLGYVLGEPLSATDRASLQTLAAADYAENAAEVREGTGKIRTFLARAKRETGPDRIGERKRQLTAVYWALTKAKPGDAAEARQYLSLLNRYNPVLARDSASGLIVTRNDIKGVVASNNFAAKLAGLPQTSRLDKYDTPSFQQQFLKLPARARKNLANGEERNARLRQTWPTLTPQRQSLVKQAVKKAMASGEDSATVGRTIESGLIERVQLIAEARRARRVAAARRRSRGTEMGRSLGEKMGTFWGMSGALNSFNN